MKALKFTALAAILAVALVFANFSSAEAKKADTSGLLSPKSYGHKTYYKVNIAKSFDDKSQPANLASYKADLLKMQKHEAKKTQ